MPHIFANYYIYLKVLNLISVSVGNALPMHYIYNKDYYKKLITDHPHSTKQITDCIILYHMTKTSVPTTDKLTILTSTFHASASTVAPSTCKLFESLDNNFIDNFIISTANNI